MDERPSAGAQPTAGRWTRIFPILEWLPTYERDWLGHDPLAGVFIVCVPEGMAYEQIAGMPLRRAFYIPPPALLLYMRSWRARTTSLSSPQLIARPDRSPG